MKHFVVHLWLRDDDPEDMPMWVMDSDVEARTVENRLIKKIGMVA